MSVTPPVHHRRVLVLGAAGLVPAALVTLLLVHQPAIGDRMVYPMLRGSLTVVGFGLALVTLIVWAATPDRLSRWSVSGLAWAGVTTLICIGPFLESSPRARLYALDLATGEVVWTSSESWTAPEMVGDDLVVTDVDDHTLVGLDPATGGEVWHRVATSSPGASTSPEAADVSVIAGEVARSSADGRQWSVPFPGEEVLAVAQAAGSAYAYVATTGAAGRPGGAIVSLDLVDGDQQWRRDLPDDMVARERAALAAGDDAVVVAGGERIGALDADDGLLRWTQNVVTLGKSRGYALPGAVQQVIVDDSMVYLSTTPDR